MDERLAKQAAAQGNVFTYRDAVALCVDTNDLKRALRRHEILRLQRNVYVLGGAWRSAPPEGRYLMRVKATLRHLKQRGTSARSSHHARARLAGLPLWGVDFECVDVVQPGVARTRRHSGIRRHPMPPGVGSGAVPLATALVQMVKASGTIAATVSADAALQKGKVTMADLTEEVTSDPGSTRLAPWLAGLDPAAESVGESRLRLLLRDLGWAPTSQVTIAFPDGSHARVDFLLGDRLVIEFDGLAKYGGLQGREALVAEKVREETLRRLGYPVLRVVWAELDDPCELRRRVLQDLSRIAGEHRRAAS